MLEFGGMRVGKLDGAFEGNGKEDGDGDRDGDYRPHLILYRSKSSSVFGEGRVRMNE